MSQLMYKLISQILILIVLSVHFLFYFIRTEYKALHLRWAWTTKLMGSADLLRGQWLDLKPLNGPYCFSCLRITGRSQGREKKKSTGHSNLLWKVWKGPLGKLKQDRQPDSAVRKPDLPPPKTEYRFIQHLPALRPTGLVNEH